MSLLDTVSQTLSQHVINHITNKTEMLKLVPTSFNFYKQKLINRIVSAAPGPKVQIIALATYVRYPYLKELKSCLNEPKLGDAVSVQVWAEVLINLHKHYLSILEFEVVESEEHVKHLQKIIADNQSKVKSH